MSNIPERWTIKGNEEYGKIIKKWANDNGLNSLALGFEGSSYYCRKDGLNGCFGASSEIPNGYTEISFETLLKYIINKESQTTEYLIHN